MDYTHVKLLVRSMDANEIATTKYQNPEIRVILRPFAYSKDFSLEKIGFRMYF